MTVFGLKILRNRFQKVFQELHTRIYCLYHRNNFFFLLRTPPLQTLEAFLRGLN